MACNKLDVIILMTLVALSKSSARNCSNNSCRIEVLEIPTEDPHCASVATCKYQDELEEREHTHMNCFCDSMCAVYGDCCKDSTFRKEELSKDTLPQIEFSVLPSEVSDCRTTRYIDTDDDTIFIIGRCPASWKEENIAKLCKSGYTDDLLQKWPVSDSQGFLYKNVYCALCNGQSPHTLTYWAANIDCEDFTHLGTDISTLLKDGTINDYCNVGKATFIPPSDDISYRKCKTYVKFCSPGWSNKEVLDLCEGPNSYTAIVYAPMFWYKNRYCALCNHEVNYKCRDMSDRTRVYGGDYFYGVAGGTYYPISLLLDLNSGFGKYGDANNRVGSIVGPDIPDDHTSVKFGSCPEAHVFDPFSGSCRMVGCKQGYAVVGDRCFPEGAMGEINMNMTDDNDCLRHVINSTEYIIHDNGLVYVNLTGETLSGLHYEMLDDGSLLVCTNFTRNYTMQAEYVEIKFNKAQTYLSIIGQVISLVALAIHFLVYSWIPALRNLAGKNLMCLVGALFVAQFFFLVGVGRTEVFWLCSIIAIIIHYTFLCAFTWMSVLSFDIFATFSSTSQPASSDSHARRFRRYSIYAWGLPLLIIFVSLILNFTLSESSVRPGYGEGLCWITYRLSLIVLFGVPVFIIVSINTVLYTLTMISICKISMQTKIVSKSSDKQRLFLYTKLSTIMGLTWMFGFIATLADVPSLWYLFIILNSLQGAFICIAFVFNKKTISLLRAKYDHVTGSGSSSDHTKSSLLSANSKARSQSVTSDNTHQVSNSIGNNSNNYSRQMSKISNVH